MNCKTVARKHPLTLNHSSLGTAASEDVALPEILIRRMLLRLKRWSSLKHCKWSVGFKEKTLRRQRSIDVIGPSMSKAL